MRYKYSSARSVYSVALSLLFFGAANGLASQDLIEHVIFRYVGSKRIPLRYYYLSSSPVPSIYEQFPELQNLDHRGGSMGGTLYFPYGTNPTSSSDPNFSPYYFYDIPTYHTISVPDIVTTADVAFINQSYSQLSNSEKAAVTGLVVAQVSSGQDFSVVSYFTHASIGSISSSGGVITYGSDGVPRESYPDSQGFANGYEQNPDGSYSPVYYQVQGNSVVKLSSLPTSDYSSLTFEDGEYHLNVPDYSPQLDLIANKLDTLNFDNITVQVPPPQVTVNSDINVPTPEVTVNVDSSDLSDIEQSLVEIGNTLVADDHSLPLSTNDLSLSSEEQSLIDSLRDWETDIPLLGGAVDFGLNTLLGKIPNIGTEYVWMDYTLGGGGSKRNIKAPQSNNHLDGYRIRIDLTPYQQTLLAIRGWLILLEALYFILLIYRNVREALKV